MTKILNIQEAVEDMTPPNGKQYLKMVQARRRVVQACMNELQVMLKLLNRELNKYD